jgi:hypothetical protein
VSGRQASPLQKFENAAALPHVVCFPPTPPHVLSICAASNAAVAAVATAVAAVSTLTPCRARLDTLSKAKYGTVLQELGGWGWLQDLLPVSTSSSANKDMFSHPRMYNL